MPVLPKRLLVCLFTFVLASALTTAALQARSQTYTAIELGTLGGTYTNAAALNDAGTVVGWSALSGDGSYHAFSYSGGSMTDLGTFAGTNFSGALAINNAGAIVGYSNNQDGHDVAVSFGSGGVNNLGGLGGAQSSAYGINESGTIVGYSRTASGDSHAFSYNSGQLTDLGTLGGTASSAKGINNAGTIVGGAHVSGDSAYLPFSYSGGAMNSLGTFGGDNGEGRAINSSGTIVGAANSLAGGGAHAFKSSGGVMTDLGRFGGAFSIATAINASGTIVGYSDTNSGTTHAFIYSNNTLLDLNFLVNLPGVTLEQASGINSSGQIIALGVQNGAVRSYLLTPVPEPSASAVLLGAVSLGLVALRRRKAAASASAA